MTGVQTCALPICFPVTITNSNGSDTKEWLNVITAINEKKITSIAEVKKYYNLSKEVEQKINELWK